MQVYGILHKNWYKLKVEVKELLSRISSVFTNLVSQFVLLQVEMGTNRDNSLELAKHRNLQT